MAKRKQDHLVESVTGVVLAGGRSTRMGRDKAQLRLDREMLVERSISVLRQCFERVILITNTPSVFKHLRLPMYKDLIPNLGPLGGIYTALHYAETPAIFVVACDMPFLSVDLILEMSGRLGTFDAVVPRWAGRFEPLHAVYHERILTAVKTKIVEGDYSMQRFLNDIRMKSLGKTELKTYTGWRRIFFNVNTPEEWKMARTLSKHTSLCRPTG